MTTTTKLQPGDKAVYMSPFVPYSVYMSDGTRTVIPNKPVEVTILAVGGLLDGKDNKRLRTIQRSDGTGDVFAAAEWDLFEVDVWKSVKTV